MPGDETRLIGQALCPEYRRPNCTGLYLLPLSVEHCKRAVYLAPSAPASARSSEALVQASLRATIWHKVSLPALADKQMHGETSCSARLFLELKSPLFVRTRRACACLSFTYPGQVEKSKMVSIGHVQGLGPLKPSLDKPTPVAEAQSTSVVRGSGPPNSIGSRPLGSRDGGGGGGDGDLNGVFAAASLSGSSSFPAAPAELHHHYHHHHHQLSPISTLLTRPGRHNKQPLQSQRQQQQQLNKRMPQQLSSSHAPSSSSSSPPLHSHHQRGPLVSSAPKEEDNQSPQHHTGVPPTATAPPPAASLVRPPRRRHSFPPNGSASGEGPAPAPPPGPAGRAARVVMGSPGLERDRSKGGRGKGGGSGGGGGGGMLASRRRVSIKDGGVGVLQVHPLVSRGGGGRGFDAAPYQTKVLFRDR